MRIAVAAGLVCAACAACAAPPSVGVADAPDVLPPDAARAYTLWLGGARIGTATETETWSSLGVHLHRGEAVRYRRGDAAIAIDTAVDIDADVALKPLRVRWTSADGHVERRALAQRIAGAWTGDAAAVPADAVPAELVPLYVRRDGAFAGRVFFPVQGFAVAAGRVAPLDPASPLRLVARLALGETPATIELDADRMPARVVDADGVIALRTTATAARAPFATADVIAATSLAVAGTRTRDARLALDGADRAPAPPAGADGPDRSAEIRALVADVRARITPDLAAAAPQTEAEVDAATRGDCTTFALAYAALAARRNIPTRVVTGFRLDADRLVRHRWATSWTGHVWLAVDAAYGEAGAGELLVALSISEPDTDGLVAGDAALARVRGAAWR